MKLLSSIVVIQLSLLVLVLAHFLASGGKQCIDVVAHHFYVPHGAAEDMVPMIRAVKAVMKNNGVGDKPLWNTETGWWLANGDGTPDHAMVSRGGWKRLSLEPEAGNYLTRAMLLARAEGIERFYMYSWDNRYGLGMMEPTSGKPKPIVGVWRKLANDFTGATGLSCLQLRDTWRCTYRRRDGGIEQTSWTVH